MAKVKLKSRKATTLAYIEHVGAYDKVPWEDYMRRLFSWAKENKAKPGFKPLGIYYDDPKETPPEQCRSEIGIPVRISLKSGEDIKIKELPAMDVATLKHVGPGEEYARTYETIHKWMTENGYEIAGPSMEIYTKKPKEKGGKTILYSEVQFPVKKK